MKCLDNEEKSECSQVVKLKLKLSCISDSTDPIFSNSRDPMIIFSDSRDPIFNSKHPKKTCCSY